MKRQQERDTSPKGKRSRYGYDDDIRDRLSPEIDRRMKAYRRSASAGMSSREGPSISMKSHREREYDDNYSDSERYAKPSRGYKHDRAYTEPYDLNPRAYERQNTPEFRTLCVSGINRQVPDPILKEALFKEFKKFGELNIKVVHQTPDHRLAFINFRYSEDALDARLSRKQLILFDQPVRVEPVFPNQRPPRPDSPQGFYNEPREESFRGRRGSPGRGRPVPQEMHSPRDRDAYYDRSNLPSREPKFPHHLQHIRPEDDDKATRTLFAGNLDYNITEEGLREIFERYGVVEDIDIKRPAKGTGNAYAFIKFRNLDMAHRAKVEFSGQYIGQYQCKIGYGKVNPTTCLWIGGLGPWVDHDTLEQEFDRFGAIHRLEWPKGKSYAYVLYDNADAAQAASQEMRGYPMGGPDRRIRVDFADPAHIECPSPPPRTSKRSVDREYERGESVHDNQRGGGRQYQGKPPEEWSREEVNSYRNPDNPQRNPEFDRRGDTERTKRDPSPYEEERNRRHRSRTPMDNQDFSPMPDRDHSNNSYQSSPKKKRKSSPDILHSGQLTRSESRTSGTSRRTSVNEPDSSTLVEESTCVGDFAKCLPAVWKGSLVLKSSAFPCKFYHVSGDVGLVDSLIGDSEMGRTLRITQRLRLDQPKLEEVGRRVSTSGATGHTVLLALPGSTSETANGGLQSRPLKNLVSYLKQKEAAGVISLPVTGSKDKDEGGVLHAFPPCQFGQEFLVQRAPSMGSDPSKDDHLVIIIVKGSP